MKYEIGESVWFMRDNRIYSAVIDARMCVENESSKKNGKPLGEDKILYHLGNDGEKEEAEVFDSKEALIDWLDSNSAIIEK